MISAHDLGAIANDDWATTIHRELTLFRRAKSFRQTFRLTTCLINLILRQESCVFEIGTVNPCSFHLREDTYATSEKALQEAMWVGVPPVVFPHGGVRDLVADGETGLVATGENGYAAAVDRIAGDAALRRRLGENARVFARAEFAPARRARELQQLLREVMEGERRTRAVLPGAGESAAAGFVRMLGDQAGAFAAALGAAAGGSAAAASDARIASASALLARGEGGVVQHRNAHPDDPHLRHWADLVTGRGG